MYTILFIDPWDHHFIGVYRTHMTSDEVALAITYGTTMFLDCYQLFLDHEAIDYLTPLV